MGLNAFMIPVGSGIPIHRSVNCDCAEPCESTTSAEPADVTLDWVDDDGSTVTHYEGEVSA